MPNITGSFKGRCSMHSVCSLNDTAHHEVSLMDIRGPQQTDDSNWSNSTIHYCATLDLIEGNGTERGYFINEHPDGDFDCGTFEGRVTTNASGQCTQEGTWKYTHGTGKFSNISGGGTFKGRLLSPVDVETTWEGTYQLAAGTRAA